MRGKNFYILLFVLFNSTIFSQSKFEFDYARFYNPVDSSGYLELYYSFVKSELNLVTVDGQELRQGELQVKIIDKATNATVVNQTWHLDITKDPNVAVDNGLMVGVLDFPLVFSSYEMEITASDMNNDTYRVISNVDFELPPLPKSGMLVSDVELATAIVPQSQNSESIFYKNSVEVTPNPSLIYGDANPVIFFYTEIYGLQKESSQKYVIEQKLYGSENNIEYQKQRNVSGENSSVVEVGAIKVTNLNSGIYTLVVSIKNDDNSISAHSAKKVYVYNRDKVNPSTNFAEVDLSPLESELMIMSEDEINYMAETAMYLATEMEKEQWNKLKDIDTKRNFLTAFWEKRDPDVSTKINELKVDYYERVNYANKNFGNVSRRQGWKTDRGRVYITYGEPGEIERFQNERYSKPYEIWQYYTIEGGIIFLFADEAGLNIYRLVHSTKKGEIYNYREYQKYVQ